LCLAIPSRTTRKRENPRPACSTSALECYRVLPFARLNRHQTGTSTPVHARHESDLRQPRRRAGTTFLCDGPGCRQRLRGALRLRRVTRGKRGDRQSLNRDSAVACPGTDATSAGPTARARDHNWHGCLTSGLSPRTSAWGFGRIGTGSGCKMRPGDSDPAREHGAPMLRDGAAGVRPRAGTPLLARGTAASLA
jgi:hypothetical protein